ncbi:hypothetical protein RUM43_011733 [Polyplax serrata]|uniref:Uncharacterized protein n=1 Tax=Polyplax serrata TaxID=468196 RepID=A0AAN8S9R4_POLSC
MDVEVENGNYFLKLLRAETSRLNNLVCSTENELEDDSMIPEDIRGKMRVAIGKGRMLLKKKFVTFEELCFRNLGIKSDVRYPVTAEDLAGYWDTIVLQILQVYSIFDEVDASRKNEWKSKSLEL